MFLFFLPVIAKIVMSLALIGVGMGVVVVIRLARRQPKRKQRRWR